MRPIDVLTSPWAIVPEKLIEICAIYSTHLRGEKIDLKAIEARIGQPLKKDAQGYENHGGVAVLPIDGPMVKKMNLFTQVSGGASMQLAERDLRMALADPSINAIVLNIDSPGGTVDGTQELAQAVTRARAQKPVLAWSDGMMTSAAYWVGSAAEAVWISGDTPMVGSIGVRTVHVDMSEYHAQMGIKVTDLYSGKYKNVGSSNAPLSKSDKQNIQDELDYLYSIFVQNVAAQRGVSESKVLADMADGRIFRGKQAVSAGLVDGVATLDALVADLAAGGSLYRRTLSNATISLPGGAAAAGAAAAADSDNGAGVASEPSTETIGVHMDLKELKDKHPDLARVLVEEGQAAGLVKGRIEGAQAERDRIAAVEAQAMPGHEALIAVLKADGKTTGPEAAVQVLAAEKAKGAAQLKGQIADAPAPAPHAMAPVVTAHAAEDANLPIEERCEAKWNQDPAIRAEFTNLEAYVAYERAVAGGKVKILGRKTASA